MTSAKVPKVSTITLEEAKVLAANEGSGVKLKKDLDLVLQIHPMYTNDIRKGVAEELNTMSKRFSKTLGGIMLGYEKVRISPTGGLMHTSPFIHLRVWANFYLFSPEVGMTLEGVVRKKSPHHLSCLVHNIINVSVSRPHDLNAAKWEGAIVEEGAKINITLTSVDMAFHLPMIKGQLESLLNSPGTSSKLLNMPSSNRITKFEEDETDACDGNLPLSSRKVFGDSGISSDEDDEKAIKKKKKKTSKLSSQTDTLEVNGDTKEKKTKKNLATQTIKQEIESDDSDKGEDSSNTEKTKKRMVTSQTIKQEIESDSGIHKEKKKKKKKESLAENKCMVDLSLVKYEPLSPNRSLEEVDEALANFLDSTSGDFGVSEPKGKKPKKKKISIKNASEIKKEPEIFPPVKAKRKAEDVIGAQKKKRKTLG